MKKKIFEIYFLHKKKQLNNVIEISISEKRVNGDKNKLKSQVKKIIKRKFGLISRNSNI